MASFEEIHQDYIRLMSKISNDMGESDPRSCSMAITRLEESLMWTSKGYFSAKQKAEGSSDDQEQ